MCNVLCNHAGTHHIITFMLGKVSQDSQRRNVTSPSQYLSLGPEIRPWDASIPLRLWSTACALGLAPGMPASAPWCPALHQYTLSKGQRCSLTFSRKKHRHQRLCTSKSWCLQCYWYPPFPEIRLKPTPTCTGARMELSLKH